MAIAEGLEASGVLRAEQAVSGRWVFPVHGERGQHEAWAALEAFAAVEGEISQRLYRGWEA